MAIAGLTVSTTEVQTTDTLFLRKIAYYEAVEGVEEVRDLIFQFPDSDSVETLSKSLNDTASFVGTSSGEGKHMGYNKAYLTGTLIDLQNNDPQTISQVEGFSPPPLPGISLGIITSIFPVVWDVKVTSEITVGRKNAYAEIQAGIYGTITIDD
jgi:hypothetical protein